MPSRLVDDPKSPKNADDTAVFQVLGTVPHAHNSRPWAPYIVLLAGHYRYLVKNSREYGSHGLGSPIQCSRISVALNIGSKV